MLYCMLQQIPLMKECSSLQDDLTAVHHWAICWQLKLNPHKCEPLAITNKRNPCKLTYCINQQLIFPDTVLWNILACIWTLSWVGITIVCLLLQKLPGLWIACDARCLAAVVRPSVWHTRQIVHPILEYAAVVWCPHAKGDINLLESIQGWAARWICGSRWMPTDSWTISSIAALNLTFPLYKPDIIIYLFASSMTSITASLSFDQFCKLNSMPYRSHHLSLIPPTSTINSRRFSFCQHNTPMELNSNSYFSRYTLNTKSFWHSLIIYLFV